MDSLVALGCSGFWQHFGLDCRNDFGTHRTNNCFRHSFVVQVNYFQTIQPNYLHGPLSLDLYVLCQKNYSIGFTH